MLCLCVCMHEKLESAQKALCLAKVDNKRLAQSVKRPTAACTENWSRPETSARPHRQKQLGEHVGEHEILYGKCSINYIFACLALYIAEAKSYVGLRKR